MRKCKTCKEIIVKNDVCGNKCVHCASPDYKVTTKMKCIECNAESKVLFNFKCLNCYKNSKD